MESNIRALIIDDHPTMIRAYIDILNDNSNNRNRNILFETAVDCETAYYKIVNKKEYDIVLLDINLPPFKEANIYSGEMLGHLIKKKLPFCKIIILTSHIETFVLLNIHEKIKPEGLLLKSEFSPEDLKIAFDSVINGYQYLTKTLSYKLKRIRNEKSFLDSTNRQIILLLSKGVLTKNLPDFLDISLSTIDKRKAYIKIFLGIEKGTDQDIITISKERGYI